MAQRVFYVTQGSLSVWEVAANKHVAEFSDDDRGLRAFDEYLQKSPEKTSAILLDVIEEEFSVDSVPKLGSRDRKALIARRSERKYRGTPFRLSVVQGKSERHNGELTVLQSAVSNHELLDPWLQVTLRRCVPLSGVYSIPLVAPSIMGKLARCENSTLFVTVHQGTRLRQVFLQKDHLRSARLSRSPRVTGEDFAEFVVAETTRSRRYFERSRLLSSMEVMHVCVIADRKMAAKISDLVTDDGLTQYSFVDPDTAAQTLGAKTNRPVDHFEEVYLAWVGMHRPKHNYAHSGQNRYWYMQRIRRVLISGAVAMAAICSVFSAILLSDTWQVRNRVADTERQLEQLAETFRREHTKFNPIQADSNEMKLAVDSGDYILRNRIPVPWVMNQLGVVMSDYPDIRIRELRWNIVTADSPEVTQRRRAEDPVMVSVPPLDAVSAELTADIVPFDGDMRAAFSRIDTLTADLQSRTDFSRASAVEYPFDASPGAALSGEVVGDSRSNSARFRVRMVYDIQREDTVLAEQSDDSI